MNAAGPWRNWLSQSPPSASARNHLKLPHGCGASMTLVCHHLRSNGMESIRLLCLVFDLGNGSKVSCASSPWSCA